MKTKYFLLIIVILGAQDLFAQYPGNPVDSIFFEHNTLPYQISPTPGNCWQVGHPSKTYFDSAYSLPLAIVTDTLNPYPINTNSSFTFTFPNNFEGSFVRFYQKYNTDTLTDYGTIEVSYNLGATWLPLVDSNCIMNDCIHLYWSDDLVLSTWKSVPHVMQPSGLSHGWIMSQYTWWWTVPTKKEVDSMPPTLISLRFTFSSDAVQTNKDGWMIDNITTGYLALGDGIPIMNKDAVVRISPNPMTSVSLVTFSTELVNSSFEVYDLVGRLVYHEDINKKLFLNLYRKDFIPGSYIWSVRSGDRQVQTGKLFVQ